MKKHIPNLFTLGNLLCGCMALLFLFDMKKFVRGSDSEMFMYVACFVLGGALLDFFDGFAARLLKVDCELGKQLDSLADMITFGAVPGFVAYKLIILMAGSSYANLALFTLIIVLMSAMRLAKFNISTNQTDSFIGLPTPANALFWIGLPFFLEWLQTPNPYVVIGLAVVFSYLLVSPIRLIALKFKTFNWKGNEARWILILTGVTALITLTTITGNVLATLPIIIILYLIISIIDNSLRK